ncbi:MAG TPA: hypothetical protein VMZ28_01610 [Kofleriaceae bacterium]|nr:hypothetical protein [Kofleriaceae bacterium]
MRTLSCLLLLAACSTTPEATTPAAVPPAAVAPNPAAEPRAPGAITAMPVPAAERLAPCAVLLVQTTYDEDTRAPTATRHAASRLLRIWGDDLRESEWHGVAPIPLTEAQARALLPDPQEYGAAAGGGVFATVGDGTLSYRFDQAGRTAQVGWDPTADSSTYAFEYAYDCVPSLTPPAWAEP